MQDLLVDDVRARSLKRKNARLGLLSIVSICILISIIVALAVLLFESKSTQSPKIANDHEDSKTVSGSLLGKNMKEGRPETFNTAEDDGSGMKELSNSFQGSGIQPNTTSNDTGVPVIITVVRIYHQEIIELADDDEDEDYSDMTDNSTYDDAYPDFLNELENTTEIEFNEPENGELDITEEEHSEPDIVSKEEWGGWPPKFAAPLDHPTPYVIICQTDGPACYDKLTCSQEMRNIQDFQRNEQQLPDVGDNFYITCNGTIFEGRGWDSTNYHVGPTRHKNIGICFIGDYDFISPTEAQLNAAKKLLSYGVSHQKLSKDYKILAHNQVFLPDSQDMGPGINLMREINTWPNRCFQSCDMNATEEFPTTINDGPTNQFLKLIFGLH